MPNSLLDCAQAFGEAWAKRDVIALRSLLGPNYIHTDVHGRVLNREEWLAYAETQMHGTTLNFRDIAAVEYDSVGVVTGANDIAGGSMGNSTIRFTQVWVKFGGEWKRVAFQATPVLK